MRPATTSRLLCLAGPALLVACSPGALDSGEGGVELDGDGVRSEGEAGDSCAGIICPHGQVCAGGACRSVDACEGVECANPGEVCDPRTGACVAGAADDDGDGYRIADGDCDDGNHEVHPDAVELCDGIDQDCDLEVDEDLTPEPCSTACGSGELLCRDGSWACSVPETCECTPAGSVETEPCGRCGTRLRTCTATLEWSEWGRCTDEGACDPGDRESRTCGLCGLESRLCAGDCEWGSWSGCSGEGECSPGSTQLEGCNDCGRRERTCSSLCYWGSWSSCLAASSCGAGYQCEWDGVCRCGPAPHWIEVGGACLPSCGHALVEAGFTYDGTGGCCPTGCRGRETPPTHDCAHCCESPPGCL
jgi:hypothetical protein